PCHTHSPNSFPTRRSSDLAQQSVADIKDVQVTHVVDHHRIANFETSAPLYYHAEPLGCSSTIILKEFKQHGVEVPANIAGMMLSDRKSTRLNSSHVSISYA